MKAIVIENVSKTFKDSGKVVHALKDVTLEIEEGEIFGILGPNGAGKSTLINILIGMVHADKGSAYIFGNDIKKEDKILEKMNYISGETKFHWSLRAREVLRFASILYNIPEKEANRRIEELIESLGIQSFATRRFDSLSTGQRIRLALAKALINNPKVLLLDEPTLGLDPHIAVKVRELIKKVNKEHKTTIILTSHYMPEVEQLCDRIAFMQDGKVLDIGEVDEVMVKQFSSYVLKARLDKAPGLGFPRESGMILNGNEVEAVIDGERELHDVLSSLVSSGSRIESMELKKPSLEDYFIKIARGDKK